MWSRFPIFKQNLIHLFWDVYTFLFSFFFKFVYHARQAKSKWGWISALQRRCFRDGVKKACLRYKNFNRPFILPRAFEAIASPDSLLSRVHPRYTTSGCCFICTSPCLISSSRIFSISYLSQKEWILFYLPQSVCSTYYPQTSHRAN